MAVAFCFILRVAVMVEVAIFDDGLHSALTNGKSCGCGGCGREMGEPRKMREMGDRGGRSRHGRKGGARSGGQEVRFVSFKQGKEESRRVRDGQAQRGA